MAEPFLLAAMLTVDAAEASSSNTNAFPQAPLVYCAIQTELMSLVVPSPCSHPTKASPVPDIAAAGLRSPSSVLGKSTVGEPQEGLLPPARMAAATCQLLLTDSVQAATASPSAFMESAALKALVVVSGVGGFDQLTPSLELLSQIPS